LGLAGGDMLGEIIGTDLFDHQSISDKVYHHVKALILSGVLKSGEKISEASLAEYFRVSKTPVREALRKLAEYGLIAIKPRSFAIVVTISDKEARGISLVRLWLERLSARCYAQSATPGSLQALRDIARKCKDANNLSDLATVYELDSQLHLAIAEHTGNSELIRILRTLDAKLQLVRLKQHLPVETLTVYLDQHHTLIRLIENKDFDGIDDLLKMHIIHDINS
jgi:DNA-binding GntR family transcriptional regulator